MKYSTKQNCDGDAPPDREWKTSFTVACWQLVPMCTSSTKSLYGSSFCSPVIFCQTSCGYFVATCREYSRLRVMNFVDKRCLAKQKCIQIRSLLCRPRTLLIGGRSNRRGENWILIRLMPLDRSIFGLRTSHKMSFYKVHGLFPFWELLALFQAWWLGISTSGPQSRYRH